MLQFVKFSAVVILIITASQNCNVVQAQAVAEEIFWEDVKALEFNTTVLLVDVREPLEITQTGIIPGAINIPRKYNKIK